MKDLLQKLNIARAALSNDNIVCITSDLDWASEYAARKTFEYFDENKVKVTAFVTNPNKAVEEYAKTGKIRLGIHPNFMPDSSQGANYDEVIDYCLKLVPGADCFRAHRYYDVNDTMDKLTKHGIKFESNVCTLMDIVPPFLHRSKTISFPIFWEDGAFLYYSDSFDFELMKKQLLSPGLKVINIHPMHLMLNTPYFSYTREIKDRLLREEWNNLNEESIEKLAYSGEGIKNYIDKIMLTIQKNNIKSAFLEDIYQWIMSL